MSRPKQSLSQLFTSFGPGAMLDLPTRSVIVAGLDHWDGNKGAFKRIEEPRLTTLLQTVLSGTGRWDPAKPVQLRTPPIAQDSQNETDPASVAVRVFPTWFTCEGIAEDGSASARRRRLARWNELDAGSGRKKFQRDDGKKVDVTPIRFVGACKKGHLQDIDWKWLVHRGEKCSEALWIEEQGTSADPSNIRIGCHCGRPSVSLADAFKPGFLGSCKGRRPWLDTEEPGCTELLHFLSRSATNTYFPQAVTIISLPIHEDALSDAIRKHWSSLQSASDPNFIGVLKNVPEIGSMLAAYSNEEIYQRIVRMREAVVREAAQDPKMAEYDLLASGDRFIGADASAEPLFAETIDVADIDRCVTTDGKPLLDAVVAVHRLKAVTCLYGFTRLEPAPTLTDEMLDDVQLAVDGAPLAEATDWLPAMEQTGEGVFFSVTPVAIREWLQRKPVVERARILSRGAKNYENRHNVKQPFKGMPYILLHSLSHAIMEEISLDCGYPLSSLKERVYAMTGNGSDRPDRFGILIYTASAGAQGTLGGLTEIAARIPRLIESSLDRLRLCSNDPVCADHDPSVAGDERSLIGAACHACALVSETSCESRNNFLDRTLLIDTVAGNDAHFFGA
ncbi:MULTISPECIES: DUF1998 domain-containing protein [unclassified Mesorhizobium]|uniref:DUF1998 domain-containing protein n=1 Tax=unclassified Mesorhizobium TaxID=325217 RepID=UPI00112D2941|nr:MULTISPECIES: DUF1998 domain-containing protein [unclassified Mesorhizobium]MBZ9696464.1 DUF1998 domain-containing protein [Mesorhizobium sp. CO1-1-9]TPK11624.1 DUF1998 domain-containing protein [Mesorhizobium sp. B2-5-7]